MLVLISFLEFGGNLHGMLHSLWYSSVQGISIVRTVPPESVLVSCLFRIEQGVGVNRLLVRDNLVRPYVLSFSTR